MKLSFGLSAGMILNQDGVFLTGGVYGGSTGESQSQLTDVLALHGNAYAFAALSP